MSKYIYKIEAFSTTYVWINILIFILFSPFYEVNFFLNLLPISGVKMYVIPCSTGIYAHLRHIVSLVTMEENYCLYWQMNQSKSRSTITKFSTKKDGYFSWLLGQISLLKIYFLRRFTCTKAAYEDASLNYGLKWLY